jgi:hypothetical protein
MLAIPVTLTRLIVKFAPVFPKRVWEHVQVLVVGALLAPGQRTMTAVLWMMGLTQGQHICNMGTAREGGKEYGISVSQHSMSGGLRR